jgi:hypothetical protein
MKTLHSIRIVLLVSTLGACATVHDTETHALETTPPEPTVRIEHHEASQVPVLRGRPFRATGAACTLVYRVGELGSPDAFRREVARSETLLRVRGGGEEWLFERNPVVPEEVTGFRVETAQQKLVAYPFSDLVLEGQARGWSSLARLGIDPDELAKLERTGASVVAFGLRFDELADAQASGLQARRVLWCDERQIPLSIERASGWKLELESLELGPAPLAGRRAAELYPEFAVQDVSDWRDGVHEHAH